MILFDHGLFCAHFSQLQLEFTVRIVSVLDNNHPDATNSVATADFRSGNNTDITDIALGSVDVLPYPSDLSVLCGGDSSPILRDWFADSKS